MLAVIYMKEFQERMKILLKDDYNLFVEALKKDDQKALYLNIRKDNGEHVLKSQYIQKHPYVPLGYYFDEKNYHPGRSPYYLAGLYYIQEPSAMLVATKMPIEKDDYVLDMCGAPGGKSCMVANKLGPQGLLIANDINLSRAKVLSENIERFGVDQAIVTSTDPQRFSSILPGFFDKIILDAKEEAEKILMQAKEETARLEKASEDAIKQAGRNLLLQFKDSITKELSALIKQEVSDSYSKDLLATLVPEVVKEWVKNSSAEDVSVLLNEKSLKEVESNLKAALKNEISAGLTLKVDNSVSNGFRIGVKDGAAFYDYSAEAVADLFSSYLNPRVAALMKEAAK